MCSKFSCVTITKFLKCRVNFENKATEWKKDIEELKVLMIADKKRTVKNGSELSEKFVTALKPVKFDASGNFQAIENSKLLNVEVIETCKELLINFLQDVLLLKEQNHFNEVKYVQPLTFVFVQKLFQCVLPEHYPQLTFARNLPSKFTRVAGTITHSTT